MLFFSCVHRSHLRAERRSAYLCTLYFSSFIHFHTHAEVCVALPLHIAQAHISTSQTATRVRFCVVFRFFLSGLLNKFLTYRLSFLNVMLQFQTNHRRRWFYAIAFFVFIFFLFLLFASCFLLSFAYSVAVGVLSCRSTIIKSKTKKSRQKKNLF